MTRMNPARRRLLTGAGAILAGAALDGCRVSGFAARPGAAPEVLPAFAPLRAGMDRITQITVCTRPFRAQGPRLDVEQLGQKTVVHNYGHGGSGWSLSWGSSGIAVQKAMAGGEKEIAVIGCGALGLTSALLLQRAGARVTIYAKELPPLVRSSLATGLWTPDSRVCFEANATAASKRTWEDMARRSFATYQSFLGLPGEPVEFIDEYFVSDGPDLPPRGLPPADTRPRFAELQRELLPDLMPRREILAPGMHSLGARYLHGSSLMMFNLTAYTRLLMTEFRSNGGQIEIDEFHQPADFVRVRERTLINATGYG